jgi:hypothetical protein
VETLLQRIVLVLRPSEIGVRWDMGQLDAQSVEEILDQTEGQGIAAQAKAIAEAIECDKVIELPPRHAVGGIITPQ